MTSVFEVPGVRVVRPLSRSDHLENLLVHLETDDGTLPAVLARAIDDTGAQLRRAELAALDRGRGPGVVALLDVVADQPAPALLLARPRGRRLSELLAVRERWEAGEVVSVLAPLVAAVGRLHRVGAAHGALTPSRIVLASEGPVIVGFERAELFAPGAPEVVLARVGAVVRDREAVRGLAALLLGAVDGARRRSAAELGELLSRVDGAALCALLETALAELAAPAPIRSRDESLPERALADRTDSVRALSRHPIPESAVASPRPAGMAQRLRAIAEERLVRLGALVDAAPTARRRLLVGGAAAVAVAAVLLAALPSGGGGQHPDPGPAPLPQASSSPGEDPVTAAVTGDDPLRALTALLALREGCLRELSVLCLEAVDQPGSPALADDRAAILDPDRAAMPGSGLSGELAPRIVERLGDSVLVEVSPEAHSASLLLMRGEAGWRIRDWVASG